MKARPIDAITIEELIEHQVWEFDLDEGSYEAGQDETWVRPVPHLPARDLENRVVVALVTLANGTAVPAIVGNICADSSTAATEFITLSVWLGDRWFHLARYFDAEYDTHGPDALSRELGLRKDDVFPIRYDISGVVLGVADAVSGEMPAEPAQRLSERERMDLILGH